MMLTGYQHQGYAQSLAEFGTSRELPNSEGWILERRIPGYPYKDAIGCYPLFSCKDWGQLGPDLENVGDELVSLAVVTDPFGNYDEALLQECFRDVFFSYKNHFVIDLSRPFDDFITNHHRRYARKAIRELNVERCNPPSNFLDDWVVLYANLIERHNITGITAFSKRSFEKQLEVPGIVAFRATQKDETIGMLLWYVQGAVGYYHLGAYSFLGYEKRASFALFWNAIEYFRELGLRWLNLGAGAGDICDSEDGLSRFKRGWATGTRTAYFCGRIFDHARYEEIVKTKGVPPTHYFPAYRQGEFD